MSRGGAMYPMDALPILTFSLDVMDPWNDSDPIFIDLLVNICAVKLMLPSDTSFA